MTSIGPAGGMLPHPDSPEQRRKLYLFYRRHAPHFNPRRGKPHIRAKAPIEQSR